MKKFFTSWFFIISLFVLVLTSPVIVAFGLKEHYAKTVQEKMEVVREVEKTPRFLAENPMTEGKKSFSAFVAHTFFQNEFKDEISTTERMNKVMELQGLMQETFEQDVFKTPVEANYIRQELTEKDVQNLVEQTKKLDSGGYRDFYSVYASIALIQAKNNVLAKQALKAYQEDPSTAQNLLIAAQRVKHPELKKTLLEGISVEEQVSVDYYVEVAQNEKNAYANEVAALEKRLADAQKEHDKALKEFNDVQTQNTPTSTSRNIQSNQEENSDER